MKARKLHKGYLSLVVIGLLLVSLVAMACPAPKPPAAPAPAAPAPAAPAPKPPAPPAAPPRVIRLGGTIPMTGRLAPGHAIDADLYREWVKMINERGGIYVKEYGRRLPVEFIVYDDRSELLPNKPLYMKLCVEDKCDLVIGAYTSEYSLLASSVAEEFHVPYIDQCAGALAIFTRGYKWISGSLVISESWLFPYLEYLAKTTPAKTVGIIYADIPFCKDVGEATKWKAEQLGLKVLFSEMVPIATMDFTPLILKLKPLNPDVFFHIDLVPASYKAMVDQMRELGYKPRVFDPILTEMFSIGVGYKDIPPGTTGSSIAWWPPYPYEGVFGKHFWYELQERIGIKDYYTTPYTGTAPMYQCLEIATRAIEIAGTLDKEKLNETLHTMRIQTIGGDWRAVSGIWEPTGERYEGAGTLAYCPLQFLEGKWQLVYPPELKEADYRYGYLEL